jgi:phosphate transport system substrate-binding protein
MKKTITTILSISFALALAACGGNEQRAAGGGSQSGSNKPLTVKGSDTMVILTQRLAEEYMKAHPGEVVQVNGGGSGTGIAALINGSADLAMASRPMKDEEKQQVAKSRGSEPVEHPIALDALGVFVNGSNRVQALTIAQLRDVFQGKVKNWKEIGGADAPIILYGRESSSGTYDYFREHVLEKGDFAPAVQTLQGTAAIINAVGKDANGIGYGGIAYAKDVRPLAIDGGNGTPVAPSEQAVADGTYPLSRKLFFYFPQTSPDRVTKFAQWSLTPEAQALVTKVGYFPLSDLPKSDAAPATGTTTDTTGTGPATTATTRTQ